MNTKDRIVECALQLFSKRGYSAVSVEEIAKNVGIKAPSLYKHFKGKQAILDAIVDEMNCRYIKTMHKLNISGSDALMDVSKLSIISNEQLTNIGKYLFSFFIHDEWIQQYRKLLVLEQFHNRDIAQHYTNQYFKDPLNYLESLFSSMMDNNQMHVYNAKIIAMHFYAPIKQLIDLCDSDAQFENEALVLLEQHLQQFNALYRVEEHQL
ncbi:MULTISPECIES: TetR/AcrR family transcriptional regulator [Breznakia]|uniref:TetR family transcriptional regulator n=1 Tax=Breznakia blatticola TaxID=1754012 RepID=A0A4R7ZTD5_9FIRM|nr:MULTISPECIES: TetR/AcrR family transcriptional regulator [Breznakia]MDH6367476.1 AcrR family transcriptional regulator [Breznakia sp. PH1-1]MDH6404551.1 AcrR family transcriptional regulator [Breznakia sp. PF1-11]MDH6412260.1 AcrR family transcriptional regulator [Breznakia sp. PFB1-11]MDH6414643.1 AcrR family transcriptional regulator [Breznakia sp. PFB1-14]MDH6417014.1 AcrR family transcriptional regulator [Breznakia sp. PFB1-4]